MNFENGFELTFNMKIEDDKCNFVYIKKCFISLFGFCIWKDTPEKKILNCGGKGFAVVLHAGGYNRGFAGAGVGY